jgi:hypothetical protein
MKRGPKPLGERAMTGAERQAKFRAAHADGTPRIRYRRPADRRSRAQRWRDAVAELVTLQEDYRAWLDSLPENLAESATAEALRAICELRSVGTRRRRSPFRAPATPGEGASAIRWAIRRGSPGGRVRLSIPPLHPGPGTLPPAARRRGRAATRHGTTGSTTSPPR